MTESKAIFMSKKIEHVGVNWQVLREARQVYEHTPYNELAGAQIAALECRIYAACLARLQRRERKS